MKNVIIVAIIINELFEWLERRKKLQDRIKFLQDELTMSLTKKSSTTVEINVGEQQRKIKQLHDQIAKLK